MTSNGPQTLTGYSFGGGGSYTASASSNYPGELPFYAFDKQDQANPSSPWNIWTTSGGYNTTTGQYTGAASTTIDGSAYNGEWLQISLPARIVLTNYTIFTWNSNLGRGPRNFKIAGSNTNNGTDWVTVDTETGITNWTAAGFSFTTTSTTAYSYFRLCVNYNNADQYGFLSISEWTLNGSNASWNTDFYADERGNLLTAPVIGTHLKNWLGGATGYVTTWYDQSGAGNHATQTTAALQPKIDLVNKQIDFKPSAYFNIPSGVIPMQTAYTITAHHNTILNISNGGICGSGSGANSAANNIRRNGSSYVNYWWANDFGGGTYVDNNKMTWKFAAETSSTAGTTYLYQNSALITSIVRSGWVGVNDVGYIGRTALANEVLNGELYSLFIFKSSLSDADRTRVEDFS
jgi:hypothetical protein